MTLRKPMDFKYMIVKALRARQTKTNASISTKLNGCCHMSYMIRFEYACQQPTF